MSRLAICGNCFPWFSEDFLCDSPLENLSGEHKNSWTPSDEQIYYRSPHDLRLAGRDRPQIHIEAYTQNLRLPEHKYQFLILLCSQLRSGRKGEKLFEWLVRFNQQESRAFLRLVIYQKERT